MSGPHQVLVLFDTAHRAHRDGWPYAFVRGKDHKLAADLLEHYTLAQLELLVGHFFVMRDPFIEQAGYGFGVFKACLPKVLADYQRQAKAHVVENMRREAQQRAIQQQQAWRGMSAEEKQAVLRGE